MVVVVVVKLDVYSIGEIPYTSKLDHIKTEGTIILFRAFSNGMQAKHFERSKHM